MANQSWVSLINAGNPASTGAGAALSTATTAALSPQASVANQDVAVVNAAGSPLGWYPGMIMRVIAHGILTTTTTSTTATIFLRANKVNGGSTFVTLATAVGITTGTTAVTGINWVVEAIVRCTAVASSGNTVSTQGRLTMGNSGAALPANPIALTATPGMVLPLPNSGGENAAAVDTTVFQGIQLAGTLAGANATLQCTNWIVEALD